MTELLLHVSYYSIPNIPQIVCHFLKRRNQNGLNFKNKKFILRKIKKIKETKNTFNLITYSIFKQCKSMFK